ncbi:MAG: hypothetical protein ACREBW_06450 [Candidatus Micrarchaeaceae archaeon]
MGTRMDMGTGTRMKSSFGQGQENKVISFTKPKSKYRMTGVRMERLAELIAQMDEPTLNLFVQGWEVDLDSLMVDNYNRMIKRAKTYSGRYWGLITLLLMNDYTVAREVMIKADGGRLDPIDDRVRFLLVNTMAMRNSDASAPVEMIQEYERLFAEISALVKEYDLHSGYFRRNTKSLKDEWWDLTVYDSRIGYGVQVGRSMYEALWILLKFRVYIVAVMPRVEVGTEV